LHIFIFVSYICFAAALAYICFTDGGAAPLFALNPSATVLADGCAAAALACISYAAVFADGRAAAALTAGFLPVVLADGGAAAALALASSAAMLAESPALAISAVVRSTNLRASFADRRHFECLMSVSDCLQRQFSNHLAHIYLQSRLKACIVVYV
jgi:hypothetical protein